jgi:bla regulator protein BlaR1
MGIIIGMNKSEERARSMEEAISLAIMARRGAYRSGETATEGHIILEVEENGPQIKVYTIASYGTFGFENGIFTKISGSGAIPTVITLGKSEEGHHALLDYKEPQDGSGYTDSIKKMFPSWLQQEALAAHHYYSDLAEQQEEQAADYLKSIGRNAEVSAAHVDKVLAKINVEASNKLFSELGKYDVFINTCPYWIGTIEQIENGVRYIYETSQEKTRDGYDIVIFRKKDIEGIVIKEVKYKIIGSEPQLME